jgi:uncharacterized phage-associated protein
MKDARYKILKYMYDKMILGGEKEIDIKKAFRNKIFFWMKLKPTNKNFYKIKRIFFKLQDTSGYISIGEISANLRGDEPWDAKWNYRGIEYVEKLIHQKEVLDTSKSKRNIARVALLFSLISIGISIYLLIQNKA